jgi:hypothetical protein
MVRSIEEIYDEGARVVRGGDPADVAAGVPIRAAS